MVTKRLELKDKQPEVFEILEHIDNQNHFLLSGGAGSGKTYSLVSIIRQILDEQPTAQIACITYTNAAVKEIEERVNHKKLKVSTIHDFLWDCIKNFQNELKKCIIDLAKEESVTSFQLENPDISIFEGKDIEYKEFVSLTEGNISHNELLTLANYMFANYSKLCDSINDKFNFIFVDEYQDTDRQVVEILLDHLSRSKKTNKTIIGFFGDTMQSIYDEGIGNLDEYLKKEDTKLKKVIKAENRRNPQKVIDLANKLRTDDVIQKPSKDVKAPNMLVDESAKEGNVLFLHSTNSDLPKLKKYLSNLDIKWNFDDSKNTKELNLTHNLIASQANFSTLMSIYDKDKFIEHLSKVRKYLKIRQVDFDDNTTVNQVFTQIAKNVKEEIDSKSLSHFTVLKYLEKLRTLHPSQNESLSDLIQKLKPIKEDKIEPSKKYLINEFKNDTGIIEIDYVYDIKILKDVEKLDEEIYKPVKDEPFIKYKNLYVVKDHLVDDKKESEDEENKKGSKRDNLIKHLFKIQHTLLYYENKNFSEFFRIIKKNERKINSIEEKRKLKDDIEKLLKNKTTTIGEVIDIADELRIVIKNDKPLNDFIKSSEYIYNRVREVSYQEFINLYNYLEGFTPYSTQHKTKGSEYDNVLIVLDNGNWAKYNFKYLFENTKDKEDIIERTQKLFYVCCTRAKENLAVYYIKPSEKVLETAKEWFGDSIINLDES
ncbi:AAA family ATPase [Flavobacterium sediminilitoris]|uniref:AAA family ATPase n=1 Tax=Flavobacterium sediminilitoris TaxID=2024526 RepID=A0ABY4HL70_9FLAO|nr:MULTISPECIES: UvrD-helicase domain-containing protein [Flavobacterium]UOX33445.1 AAA family ATPase [Flavobacterium sediminilitoris]